MAYATKPPAPETLVARSKELGAELYAELAECPLYANCRLIAAGYVGKRTMFRLGWVIKDARLVHGKDRYLLPQSVLDWITENMRELYGSHADTGLSDEEVAELEAEQKAKRESHKKSKA